MTDKEQIEEMAKIMFGHICTRTKCDSCKYPNKQKDCEAYRNAEALYNAGYRKSDEIQLECENASLTVENEVLKRDVQNLERTLEEGREEYKRLKNLEKYHITCEDVNEYIEIARRETAKEILQALLECSEMVETDGQEFPFIYTENIFSLAKKYGVEVKE